MKGIEGLISIARKGGFVILGQDNLKGYTKKLYLLLLDKSAGASLMREINFLSKNKGVPLLEIKNLNKIVNLENCKVIGIKNKAISDNILKILKGE